MSIRLKKPAALVWVFFLSLLAAAPALAAGGNEPPRRLTPRGLENLVAFGRLFGYIRFFHPSDQAAAADWDRVALAGVQEAEKAVNAVDLARTLERFFEPLAPTVRVFPDGERPEVPAGLAPPSADAEVIFWEHNGVALPPGHRHYSSRRSTARTRPPAETGLPLPAEPLVVPLGGGVSAMLPLTLYRDAGGTLPRVTLPPPRPDKPAGFVPSGKDRATRLAGVALAWPVFQHFYPYFDVVSVDWPGELRNALTKAAKDRNEGEWADTLRRLVATLQDGHGAVLHPARMFPYQLPLDWEWIEDQLVITHVLPQVRGLAPGDVVLTLDGRPAAQAVAAAEALASSATPQWRRIRALRALVRGERNETVRLKVRRLNGQTVNAVLRKTVPAESFSEPRPEKIAEVQPGIFYVDLERITDADFVAALGRLASARGIVFDLRVYPNLSPIVLSHLAAETLRTAPFRVPYITRPDGQVAGYDDGSWTISPSSPRLTGRIAFLTSGWAISYAETYLGIVERYRLGEIVGGPTAGTNGNVNSILLPGNARLLWTGMQVLKHDGSRLHGVGIHPTVPVSRTVQGVAAGRDEVLEKAVEVVGGSL